MTRICFKEHYHMTKEFRKTLFILLGALCLLLSACGSSDQRFRLEGEFKNMNQAEFYLYNMANGHKDTIHVQRGRFVYETDFADTATLVLMFPNFSQIPIFASQGITVTMKGDASQLRETKLKGSKENEEMTAFRLKANQLTPPEMTDIAASYIADDPTSPVSFYLLQQYFVKSFEPDYRRALSLCDLMFRANPYNTAVAQLRRDLLVLNAGGVGSKVPPFALLDTRRRVVTNGDMQAKVNVTCLWSSWNYDSRSQLTILRQLLKKHPKELTALGISIDATAQESREFLRRDTITFPIVIDGKMWQTPMVRSLGFSDVPANIVSDHRGRIIARNIPTKELNKKLEELLK